MVHLIDTRKKKRQSNMLSFGAWGCAEDPMLREYKLKLDPRAKLRILGQAVSVFFCLLCSLGILAFSCQSDYVLVYK